MKALFADTSFFIAFMNVEDHSHSDAYDYMALDEIEIVTTDWVLIEFGNYLSRRAGRKLFEPLVKDLRCDGRFSVLAANHEDFDAGLRLFGQRRDKQWSMTDCISFNLMEREGIIDALTSDHHFEQAGFRILLGS